MVRAGSEADLYEQITEYLLRKHPGVIFRWDYGAGLKMTMRQAVTQKRLNPWRGFPDLAIYRPATYAGRSYPTGFFEVKREGTKLKKRDGSWVNEHVAEQASLLRQLAAAGYVAQFVCGLDEARVAIDSYLGTLGTNQSTEEF